MAVTILSSTSVWEFDVDVVDDSGPFDMTGLDCLFVFATKENAEVARATTASGGIVAITGPSGATGRSRLQVTIPYEDHDSLIVSRDFEIIDGDLGINLGTGSYRWLGKQEWRVYAGPNWTGGTGA